MKDFKKLLIWQRGISLVERIYRLTAEFPDYEKFGLKSQLQRSAISIPSNIAEGCSRRSIVEQCRYLEIALGSCFELETQVIVSEKLNYIPEDASNDLLQEIREEQMMITGYMNKVKENI